MKTFIIFIPKQVLIYQKVLGVIRIDKMASFFFKGQFYKVIFTDDTQLFQFRNGSSTH